ncbi:Hypothetical_protein [Hexamita inflata]|uniref:Hypothetical_protein n=1 Tax=Hexamita inflata TaxID=28002 RepID=A0AA86N8U5_9EUKA|nr:Hypothetical protein HINF_LOCUS2780 [Hexamita inflata]CAI9915139.1 Hypothetical protein HINF_LOCUS2784 [Hexamita inflata]
MSALRYLPTGVLVYKSRQDVVQFVAMSIVQSRLSTWTCVFCSSSFRFMSDIWLSWSENTYLSRDLIFLPTFVQILSVTLCSFIIFGFNCNNGNKAFLSEFGVSFSNYCKHSSSYLASFWRFPNAGSSEFSELSFWASLKRFSQFSACKCSNSWNRSTSD